MGLLARRAVLGPRVSRYVYADPKPFAHQVEGLKRLMANQGRYALLWEPGVGKTRPVIDYAGALATAGDGELRLLVVCPKVVQDGWLKQAAEYLGPGVGLWAEVLHGSIAAKSARLKAYSAAAPVKLRKDQLALVRPPGAPAVWLEPGNKSAAPVLAGKVRVTLMVLNLEALSSRAQVAAGPRGGKFSNATLIAEGVAAFKPHILVVDESHRIKSPRSNVTKLVRKISATVPRRILLTGTPMPHSPLDVWAQWQVIDPDAFSTAGRPWNYDQFQARYAITGGYLGREVIGFQNLEDLQDRLARRSYPLAKEQALDLPPTMDITHDVHLSPTELDAYAAMKRDLVAQIGNVGFMSAPNRLTQMLRLRQITCGFVRDDNTGAITQIGSSREDVAVGLLEDLLASERRVVVFAWSRVEVDRLVARLRNKPPFGAEIHGITGDTPDPERQSLRERFGDRKADGRMVLVCQMRTVSLGINEMVTASHAIFLSLSQQRDDLVQAMGRLDRQGQTKPCTFHFLVAPNTVDQIILDAHRSRSNLESALLDHIRREQGNAHTQR